MNRPVRKIFLLSCACVLIGACGAAVPLPESETSDFSSVLRDAVWHPEFGDRASVSSLAGFRLEDGSQPENALVVKAMAPSSYINGVFMVDLPDRDSVTFEMDVGFLNQVQASGVAVRLYLQNNDQFVPLAETKVEADGKLDHLVADLSAYRGQSRLMILSISSLTASVITESIALSLLELKSP